MTELLVFIGISLTIAAAVAWWDNRDCTCDRCQEADQ